MKTPSHQRFRLSLPFLIVTGMASLLILSVWAWSVKSSPMLLQATTGYSPVATSTVPVQTPSTTAVAGEYSIPALKATTEAIARSLPTIAPNPNYPPDKGASFALAELYDIARATAIALYPPPPGYVPPTPSQAPQLYPKSTPAVRNAGAGIIDDEGGIQDSTVARVIHAANLWGETVGNRDIVVYAGFPANTVDASRGLLGIFIYDHTTYELLQHPETYEAPGGHGYLRIRDAVGEQLVIQAHDGTTMGFDVSTRQWVSPPLLLTPTPSVIASPVATP